MATFLATSQLGLRLAADPWAMTEPRLPEQEPANEQRTEAASPDAGSDAASKRPADPAPASDPEMLSTPATSASQPAPSDIEQTAPIWTTTNPYDTVATTASAPAAVAGAAPRRGLTRGLVAAVLAAGLVGGGAGAAVTAALDDDSPATSSLSSPASGDGVAQTETSAISQVAAAVTPSVVSIQVSGRGGSGEGSGVVISSDGQILTNNHVVEAADNGGRLQVTLADGDTASATIVGRDPDSDLAVIQAEGVDDLQPATLGSSADLVVGEPVVAIGSPLGLQGTVTSGIVSALDREVVIADESNPFSGQRDGTVLTAIQTDAAINPGNSGGPLVNMRGEVIGINTAIASLPNGLGSQSGSIGLGFAIPIDQARRIADQLASGDSVRRALLGVEVSDADATGDAGALIQLVTDGGPADEAGLQVGDLITSFGDRQIDGSSSLVAAVRAEQPGAEVEVTYARDGETATVDVTLGTQGTTAS